MQQDSLLDDEKIESSNGPVECLGQTFANEEARRKHFTKLLSEKLKDPEFRAMEGFPSGSDETILELSDPPFFTLCPNPFFEQLTSYYKSNNHKVVMGPSTEDIKVGKNDPAYNAHSYHTKVPHQAIIRNILHYTDPGDIVLDSFSGSGMTALAASKCGEIETLSEMGYSVKDSKVWSDDVCVSKVGARTGVVSDLSPIAAFMSYNYSNEFDELEFDLYSSDLLNFIKEKYGEYYETDVLEEEQPFTFTIWSEVHICSSCEKGNIYWDLMTNSEGNYDNNKTCKFCGALFSSRNPNREFETVFDKVLNKVVDSVKYVPVKICYNQSNRRLMKSPNKNDLAKIINSFELTPESWLNTDELKKGDRWKRDALGLKKIHYTHQFFTHKNFSVLSDMMAKIQGFECSNRTKNILRTLCTACISRLHKLNRYIPKHNRHVGPMSGTLYVSPLWVEISPIKFLEEKIKAHKKIDLTNSRSFVSNNSATKLMLEDNSIDYIFTDPPFGENLQYSELNAIYESFINIRTNDLKEAVINKPQGKSVDEYRELMTSSFNEYYRVLKPGKWITVEFSNSKNTIWISIQEAISKAGFIVCDVSILDKKKGTTKQLSLQNAVKQDLIISAYKPSEELLKITEESTNQHNCCWSFIEEHLSKLPRLVIVDNHIDLIAERTKYTLFDRMVSYFVQRNKMVPIDAADFYAELNLRYQEIDGMIFSQEQQEEYRKGKSKYNINENLDLLVSDEKSSINWLRNKLLKHPKKYSEIHPEFLSVSKWNKNEKAIDLIELLELNFLIYDGVDEIPPQIHTYLSSNYKEMRNLTKDSPALKSKAKDRWYVPDLRKSGDLEKLRLKALLREFKLYVESNVKIKQPRAEALRAGFNYCWENQDLQIIIDVADKVPSIVLQEDENLLMFYDNALTLTSNDDDDWD